MEKRKNIRLLDNHDITDFFLSHGEKKFRTQQLNDWLWSKAVTDIGMMSNFSEQLRQKLDEEFVVNAIKPESVNKSEDGSCKIVFCCYDSQRFESVLIPAKNRVTVCVSVQTGCSAGCKFCASGKKRRFRNLEYPEIFDQIVYARTYSKEVFNAELTNIVFMGMGEPFFNYENLRKAIEKITGTPGLGMSNERLTVSTVGIADMIKRAADDDMKFNIAFSLHATTNEQRNSIIPVNKKFNIEENFEALAYFSEKTRKKVTIEYVMISGVNDKPDDLKRLISLVSGKRYIVNIIPYNQVEGIPYLSSTQEIIDYFVKTLTDKGVIAKVRESRGGDIGAACGQLAG